MGRYTLVSAGFYFLLLRKLILCFCLISLLLSGVTASLIRELVMLTRSSAITERPVRRSVSVEMLSTVVRIMHVDCVSASAALLQQSLFIGNLSIFVHAPLQQA